MGEKTRFNNDQEDELNQSRFLVERGAEVVGTQSPSEEGTDFEEEDIAETKSRFREQPAGVDEPSEEGDKSPFYGQGFGEADDTGIRRAPEASEKDERESLGS